VLDLDGFECHQAGDAKDGIAAAQKLEPQVVIMDIQLPDSSGFQICQELRKRSKTVILIMMTGRFLSSEEKKQGFELGADEYITKPFDWEHLRARLQIGVRIAKLQQSLAQRVKELQAALDTVKVLSGLLPICSYCKRIRNDGNYWQQLETYIGEHTDAQFSHGVCPTCLDHAKKEFGLVD
jgi:DNA-binding response OmpR family regulator